PSTVDVHHLCSLFLLPDASPTSLHTLSLHDALPILSREPTSVVPTTTGRSAVEVASSSRAPRPGWPKMRSVITVPPSSADLPVVDRKSTRLNSSHVSISYAVFCLKKKKEGTSIGCMS